MDPAITREEQPQERARGGARHHREAERGESLVHPEELHREARRVRAHRVVEGVAEREQPAAQEEHDTQDRERLRPRERQEKGDPLGQEGRHHQEEPESRESECRVESASDRHERAQILRAST